jgi:hypothetical protein
MKTKATKRQRHSGRGVGGGGDSDDLPSGEPLNLKALKQAYLRHLADSIQQSLDSGLEDNEFDRVEHTYIVLEDTTLLRDEEPSFEESIWEDEELGDVHIFMHPRQRALLRRTDPLVLTHRWVEDHPVRFHPDNTHFYLLVGFHKFRLDLSKENVISLTLSTSCHLSHSYFVGKTPCPARLLPTPLRPRRCCKDDSHISCIHCHSRIACSECAAAMKISPVDAHCPKCLAKQQQPVKTTK